MSSPSSSDAASSDTEERVHRQAAEDEAAKRQRAVTRNWFRRCMLARLCELYYEEQLLGAECSSRQRIGRMSAFKRRADGETAENIISYTCIQLSGRLARKLRQDTDMLEACFLEPIPPNDEAWIRRAGKWGDPTKARMAQRMELQLTRSLATRLQVSDTASFVHDTTTFAGFHMYLDFLWDLWALLSSDERYECTMWYQNMPTGARVPDSTADEPMAASDHCGVAEWDQEIIPPSDNDVENTDQQEPPSGSRDGPWNNFGRPA
ncbi:unnamed protein product [Symbiodinium sp. CCMP2592]|nr:unnamed protein product [Symbiodinium sp. CCMP2592]